MGPENLIRMIRWEDFWEPTTIKQKCIKWGGIAMVMLLGISIFLLRLDNLQAYEYACKHPIIVEAERKLVYTHDIYHEIYLSYTYDGVKYEDIYYRTSKNPSIRWDGITTLTVAVDPNDPSMPIQNMFSPSPTLFGLVLWSLGLSMLIYGSALEFRSFRKWRVKRANQPVFLSRPYGKPAAFSAKPEYLTDFIIISLPVIFIHVIILTFVFPCTF